MRGSKPSSMRSTSGLARRCEPDAAHDLARCRHPRFGLIAALRGWKRGFVSELAGFVALVLGLWSGYRYSGSYDTQIERWAHLGPGSAHVVGMAGTAFSVYVVLLIASLLLGRIAKLPVLGFGNAL